MAALMKRSPLTYSGASILRLSVVTTRLLARKKAFSVRFGDQFKRNMSSAGSLEQKLKALESLSACDVCFVIQSKSSLSMYLKMITPGFRFQMHW